MSKNVRIEVDPKAVTWYLKGGGGVKEVLLGYARPMAATAGPGMEVDYDVGAKRARASVRTATFAAMRAEATTRALSRSLGAGR